MNGPFVPCWSNCWLLPDVLRNVLFEKRRINCHLDNMEGREGSHGSVQFQHQNSTCGFLVMSHDKVYYNTSLRLNRSNNRRSSQAGVKAVAGALTQHRQGVVSLGIYEKIWCPGSGVGKLRIETSFCFLLVAYDLNTKPDPSLSNCLGTPCFIPPNWRHCHMNKRFPKKVSWRATNDYYQSFSLLSNSTILF